MESTKQSNKISDIVRLKQKLKKWRSQAHNAQTNNTSVIPTTASSTVIPTAANSSNSNGSSSNGSSSSSSNVNRNSNSNSNGGSSAGSSSSSSSRHVRKGSLSRSNSFKGISFLKRTLSLSDNWGNIEMPVKKGFPPMDDSKSNNSTNTKSTSNKGITFLKRTLSFTDMTANSDVSSSTVRKGFLAVHVGVEMKRFVIPTNYLGHEAFSTLLKEAEEEFGFQQEGVLKIPCEVQVFESILKSVEEKNRSPAKQGIKYSRNDGIVCGPSESLSYSHHPPSPMCR